MNMFANPFQRRLQIISMLCLRYGLVKLISLNNHITLKVDLTFA